MAYAVHTSTSRQQFFSLCELIKIRILQKLMSCLSLQCHKTELNQLSMKFFLLTNAKMPKIVGILTNYEHEK